MYRWYGLDNVPADWGGSVAIIGVFDGVHRGHQRIIGRAVELARARNLPVVVITFDPHPDEVVRPGPHPPSLTSERRLAQLLAGLFGEQGDERAVGRVGGRGACGSGGLVR